MFSSLCVFQGADTESLRASSRQVPHRWSMWSSCAVKCVKHVAYDAANPRFRHFCLLVWVFFFFSKMDEVIDNIISMQSNYDDLQRYIDPVQMPNTVSLCHTLPHCRSFFSLFFVFF